MIAVMGASGNTGRAIVQDLRRSGEQVRALGRSADKLKPLAELGAEIALADVADRSALDRAFAGADAVYTLIPPNTQAPDFRAYQDRVGEATAAAIRSSGVRHVVFLSSVGADLPEGNGPIAGLHAQEQRLRALPGVSALFLRAGYFFENAFATLSVVKQQGINPGAIAPEIPIPMVATADIAAVAAEALRKRDFQGAVAREVLGPRDLTLAEQTRILGQRIGKPDLPYVQVPYDAFAGALVQMGLSASVAGLYAEMARGFNEGRIKPQIGRRPEVSTPTRFEDFAEVLARAYAAG
jgi:uncharacterized protein YbjT (DUF2867 family)